MDGVNDAPSLKIADIGVAMGKGGTDVAKGAADVILVDDNFITIVRAVKEGRNLFNNIKKSVSFLLRANLGEVVMMCTAIFSGLASPLSTIQILWVNLVTDTFPGLALGMDTKTDEVMKEQPRNVKAGLLNKKDYASIVYNGLLCGFAALMAFMYPVLSVNGEMNFAMLKSAMVGDTLALCRTYAFTALVVAELLMAYVSKAGDKSILKAHLFDNRLLNMSVLIGILIQVLFISVAPLANILGVTVLNITDWIYITMFAFIPVVLSQLKFIFNKK